MFSAAIVLRYHGSPDDDAAFAEQMVSIVQNMCESEVEILDVDSDRPTLSVYAISEVVGRLAAEHSIRTALVDISGLTQMFGVAALHACVSRGIMESVFYAEAESYFPLQEDGDRIIAEATDAGTYDYWELLQSEGLQSVHIHPEFGGGIRTDHPLALAVFLGYEPSRVRGLLDEYSPSGVVGLVGHPPHSGLEWRAELSRRLHEPFLQRWPYSETDVSTYDVDGIYEALSAVYASLGSEYDLGIALQCSKLQMLASYWFWQAHPEVQLVFTSPIAFNRTRYSEGTGPQLLLARSGGDACALVAE